MKANNRNAVLSTLTAMKVIFLMNSKRKVTDLNQWMVASRVEGACTKEEKVSVKMNSRVKKGMSPRLAAILTALDYDKMQREKADLWYYLLQDEDSMGGNGVTREINDLIQVDGALSADLAHQMECFTGVDLRVLDMEDNLELTDRQMAAVKKLYQLELQTRDEEQKEFYRENRIAILEDKLDKEYALDEYIDANREDDIDDEDEGKFDRTYNRARAKKGLQLVETLRSRAKDASYAELIRWNKKLKEARLGTKGDWTTYKHTFKLQNGEYRTIEKKVRTPKFKEDRLPYIFYVASKMVLECYISKRTTGRVKARAAQAYVELRKKWNEIPENSKNGEPESLRERYGRYLNSELMENDGIDANAVLFGKGTLSHHHWAEMIDLKQLSDDPIVLQSWLLRKEAENYNLPKGTTNVSVAMAMLALIKTKGNKAAAARMVDMPYSTFRDRIKKAMQALSDARKEKRLDEKVYHLMSQFLSR